MRQITLFIFGIFLSSLLHGQSLTVGKPHEGWWNYSPGTIEDAEIIIHPQGLYLGIDMYLTFSARGANYKVEDTIEAVFNFSLPHGSIIYDSWLWLNQDTLKADLIDFWTATSIYDSIVGRKQDPSILYKTYGDNYELRVYPMQGDSTRRVKLSYLTPLTYTSNSVFASLPLNFIYGSVNLIENVKIRIKTDETWKNPRIIEHPEFPFDIIQSSEFETNKLLTVYTTKYYHSLTLQLDSPLKNGIFINKLDDKENYYQLAYLPSYFKEKIRPKNVLICIDYSHSYNSADSDAVFNNLKSIIKNGLAPIDSFNLMFSSADIKPVSINWVSVKDIDSVFKEFTQNPIIDYSNLPTLLTEAVNFVNNTYSGGEIMLVANTNIDGEPVASDTLIADLLKKIGEKKIPIHCANFLFNTSITHWAGSDIYSGNEYLYLNLARQTNGNYVKASFYQEISDLLIPFFQLLVEKLSTFNLQASVNNGICYSRFDLNGNEGFVYLNKPLLQIGKFEGEMPFNIEFSGIYNDSVFTENITINFEEIMETDTLLEEIWAGNYINMLENSGNLDSNEIVREIIDYSISERVLSFFTAFLAIEPGAIDSALVDFNFEDNNGDGGGDGGSNIENTTTNDVNAITLKVYPNPFNYETNFELELPDSFTDKQLEVKIYDISGKVVYSDMIQNVLGKATVNYTWNGNDNNGRLVPKGTYIVVFSSSTFNEVVKVLKM